MTAQAGSDKAVEGIRRHKKSGASYKCSNLKAFIAFCKSFLSVLKSFFYVIIDTVLFLAIMISDENTSLRNG